MFLLLALAWLADTRLSLSTESHRKERLTDLVLGKPETAQVPIVSFGSYSGHSRCLSTEGLCRVPSVNNSHHPLCFVVHSICACACGMCTCFLGVHPQHSGGHILPPNFPESNEIKEAAEVS